MDDIFNSAINTYRQGDYAKAIEQLSEVVETNQQHWLAWFYLGLAYLKSNDTDRAYRIMRVVAALCPLDHLKAMSAALLPEEDEEIEIDFEMREAS